MRSPRLPLNKLPHIKYHRIPIPLPSYQISLLLFSTPAPLPSTRYLYASKYFIKCYMYLYTRAKLFKGCPGLIGNRGAVLNVFHFLCWVFQDFSSSKLKDKQCKQKTSPKSYKTEIKILVNPVSLKNPVQNNTVLHPTGLSSPLSSPPLQSPIFRCK